MAVVPDTYLKNILVFPSNLGTSYEDFIKISTYKYVTYKPSIVEGTSSASEASDTEAATPDTETESADGENTEQETTEETTTELPRFDYTRPTNEYWFNLIKDKTKENIFYLPMPSELNFADGQSWEAQNVGSLGFYAGSFIQNLVNMDSANLAAAVGAMAEAGLSEFALRLIDNITSSSFVTQQSAGKVINPYREQIFNGMQMRAFTFTYKFVPSSKPENDTLQQIIKTFRKDALPTTTKSISVLQDGLADENGELPEGVNESLNDFDNRLEDRWFDVPRIFTIEFLRKSSGNESLENIKTLPRLKPCICKGFSVNYAPDGAWMTRTDGSPMAYEITMDFEEMEIVVSQDIDLGY